MDSSFLYIYKRRGSQVVQTCEAVAKKILKKENPLSKKGKQTYPEAEMKRNLSFASCKSNHQWFFFLKKTFKLYYNLELQTGLPALTRNKQVSEHTHLNPLSFPYMCKCLYLSMARQLSSLRERKGGRTESSLQFTLTYLRKYDSAVKGFSFIFFFLCHVP